MLIDDGNPVRSHPRDGAGHQILNGAHLIGIGRAAADTHGDGGRRLLGGFLEQLALGQNQMDAGEGHPIETANGAGQLAL